MNTHFFEHIQSALAVERLDAYRQDGASPLSTLSRYLWNMALCESLYSPLQMAEIALRNRIHTCFTDQFSVTDWYTTSGLLLPWQEEMVDKARKLLSDKASVTSGKMIAELHFGFWTGFFNKAHARTGIADFLTKPVFQYAPKHERVKHKLSIRLTEIRDLRNRVFHHERIIHWENLPDQHIRLIETIGWISPEIRELTEKLDTFTGVYDKGIDSWKDKIRNHWPAETTNNR
jgi:hypothetical protein